MKIALIGYGKMGQAIETIALQKGHEIVLTIDAANQQDLTKENLSKADVAIEFTGPESAEQNIRTCIQAGVPVISGSTGWTDKLEEVKQYCIAENGGFLYASNFSVGVNIFFELNRQLAALMLPHPEYKPDLEEIHHTGKKDAPSGTAITLAEGLMEIYQSKTGWVNEPTNEEDKLAIISKREDPAPGTHKVSYRSPIDDIEIIHTAHSREGFASGAVLAAEYIAGKTGVFTMKHVLQL